MIVRATVAGGLLEASDDGPREAASVVLLHGFTGSRTTWSRLVRRFATSRRMIAIDLPGHGRSDARSGNFDDTVRAIATIAETIVSGPAAWIGYSLGGRLALAMALARPDLVERLLLESASPGIADDDERIARRRDDDALAERIERDGVEAFVDHWECLPLFATLRGLPPAERDALRRQRLGCSSRGLAASLRTVGGGRQPWLGDRLGEIVVPVTLVAGGEDAKYRAIAAAMAARIPRSALEIVGGTGHAPHLERTDAFEAIVDRFLSAPSTIRSPDRVHEGEAP
jgi:2-succinyl-6-hydroxy-2,4-cyclohexadiene-1-carboxylate synthase